MTQEYLEDFLDRYGLDYILEVNDVELWQVLKLLVEDRMVDLNEL